MINFNRNFTLAYKKIVRNRDLPSLRKCRLELLEIIFKGTNFYTISKKSSLGELEELAVKQKISKLLNSNWNKKNLVLKHNGNTAYFILPPHLYQKIGLNNKEKIVSFILFFISSVVYSLAVSLKTILNSLNAMNKSIFIKNSVYCFNFKKSFKPQNSKIEKKSDYSLGSMLINNYYSDKLIVHSCLSISSKIGNLRYAQSFYPEIEFKNKVFFCANLTILLIKLVFYILLFRWKKLIIFDDIINAEYFKLSSKLYDEYIFLYQGSIYRPLWTWVAEKKGSSISMHMYSANSEPNIHENYVDEPFLEYSCWEKLYTFNKLFITETKKRINYSSRVIGGSTRFFSDSFENPLPPKTDLPMISVFDYAPKYPQNVCPINKNYDYISYYGNIINFYVNFYNQIIQVAKKHNFHIVIKPKRNDLLVIDDYKKLLTKLKQNKRITIVSSEISAFRLVDYSDGAIVQPFSSIGYYYESKTPITFFDPLKLLNKNLNQERDQNLCCGVDELSRWADTIKINFH